MHSLLHGMGRDRTTGILLALDGGPLGTDGPPPSRGRMGGHDGKPGKREGKRGEVTE